MSETITQEKTKTFLRVSICRDDKFVIVVEESGIDSKGKAAKIPFIATFLSSEYKTLISRLKKIMSNKILLVFEKYDLILFFKFFTPARKTIEKRMAKVLL